MIGLRWSLSLLRWAPKWADVSPSTHPPPLPQPFSCEALDCNCLSDLYSHSTALWGQKEVCARPHRGHAEEVMMSPTFRVCVYVCLSWSSPLSYLKLLCLFWEMQPCHYSLLPCFVLVLLPFLLRRPVIGCGFFPRTEPFRALWWLTFPPPYPHQPAVPCPKRVGVPLRQQATKFYGKGSHTSAPACVLSVDLPPARYFRWLQLSPLLKKWTVLLSSRTFIKMKWHFSLALPRVSGRSVLLFSPSIHDCDRDRKAELDPFGD